MPHNIIDGDTASIAEAVSQHGGRDGALSRQFNNCAHYPLPLFSACGRGNDIPFLQPSMTKAHGRCLSEHCPYGKYFRADRTKTQFHFLKGNR